MSTSNVVPFPTKPDEQRAEELAAAIRDRLELRFSGMVRSFPRNQPIASDIDPDSCLRRQVFQITHWQDKAPIPADRQGRLEAGNDAEAKGITILKDLGFRVVMEQVPFELKHRKTGEPCLRGKVDGFIRWEGEEVPFEIKSFVQHVFPRINSVDDHSLYWWTRKYPHQLQAYCIGYGKPVGVFFDTDLAGNWKPIPIVLDYELAERIWSFAESALDHVKAWRKDGSLPGFSKDPAECARCEFFGRTCQPNLVEHGAAILADPELVQELERREALLAAGAKEYERIDDAVKKRLRAALVATPRNEGETIEAYGARVKALGAQHGIAGRFSIAISAKFVKGDPAPAPRAARVDRVVSIEPLTDKPMAPPLDLMGQLKASLAKTAKPKDQEA